MTSAIRGLFVLAGAMASEAYAIQGTLLPRDQLPEYVCALQAEKYIIHSRTLEGATQSQTHLNTTYCTAFAKDDATVVTGAHCDPAHLENLKIADSFGTVSSFKIEGSLKVVCGSNIRRIERAQFRSNPMFTTDRNRFPTSKAERYYDASIIQLTERLTGLRIPRIARDFAEVLRIAQRGTTDQNCRTYGYGVSNDGKRGILNGGLTPIMTLTQRVATSDMLEDEFGKAVAGAVIRSGDSGGPLVCSDQNGADVIVGIASRGDRDFNLSDEPTDISLYALTSFLSSWIGRSTDAASVADRRAYLYEQLLGVRAQAIATYKKFSNKFKKPIKREFKAQLDALEKNLPGLDSEKPEEALFEAYDRYFTIEQQATKLGKNIL